MVTREATCQACGLARTAALLAVTLALPGCAALDHGFLAAAGPVADGQRTLFFIIAGFLVFIGGPVLLLTPVIAWYYRLGNTRNAYRPKWTFSWRLEGYIWIPPLAFATMIAVVLYWFTVRLDPYRTLPGPPPLEVQAVALDWKWVFIYPDGQVASADRLVVPAGRPVRLSLTSGTVMQSILIPRLSGQIYSMAGMKTQLNIQADRPGRYFGENTQYNGDGFAHQKFAVDALPERGFAAWLASAKAAPRWDDATARRLTERGLLPGPQTFSAVPNTFFAGFAQGMGHGHDPEHSAEHGPEHNQGQGLGHVVEHQLGPAQSPPGEMQPAQPGTEKK